MYLSIGSGKEEKNTLITLDIGDGTITDLGPTQVGLDAIAFDPAVFDTREDIVDDAADAGEINDGQATSVRRKLQNSEAAFIKGEYRAACNQSGASAREWYTYVLQGKKTLAEWQEYVDKVDELPCY